MLHDFYFFTSNWLIRFVYENFSVVNTINIKSSEGANKWLKGEDILQSEQGK